MLHSTLHPEFPNKKMLGLLLKLAYKYNKHDRQNSLLFLSFEQKYLANKVLIFFRIPFNFFSNSFLTLVYSYILLNLTPTRVKSISNLRSKAQN